MILRAEIGLGEKSSGGEFPIGDVLGIRFGHFLGIRKLTI